MGSSEKKRGRPMVLYSYSTECLSKTDKVRFYYALKGRDGRSGIVRRTKTFHIGKTVLLAPFRADEDLKMFLTYWKLPFIRRKLVLLEEKRYERDYEAS